MPFKVNCALEYYKTEEKSVVVLPWRLNIDSQTEIRTEGLFAALNDCLYRNMNDFRYLMLIDFDEFIVPHTNDTLPQMLAHVDAQKIIVTGNIGRYVLCKSHQYSTNSRTKPKYLISSKDESADEAC